MTLSKCKITVILLSLLFFAPLSSAFSLPGITATAHPIDALVGEKLDYDISFLWFDHLAEGSLSLTAGAEPATFLIVLEARTLGVAAFFTRNRVDRYETLMRIGRDGFLIPVWHSSHTIRGSGSSRKERIKRYEFDYQAHRVIYKKIKNGQVTSRRDYPLDDNRQLYDILSALYNLRLNFYPPSEQGMILIPTFDRKGPQDIVIAPLRRVARDDQQFFGIDTAIYQILVDPEVFGTKGRDILASFDPQMRPLKGVIKNVIGLGDVRGTLRAP